MDEKMLRRFWAKVNKDGPVVREELGPCWVWTACQLKAGYGLFGAGKLRTAHRVSYEIANGAIPDGSIVLHRCDVPACVRPDHLRLGTHAENTADMIAKGRGRLTGAANGNARIDEDTVRAIVEAVRGGTPRKEAARRFGVSLSSVGHIMTGRLWPQVTGIRRTG
jgi:hypothetical protein